MDQVEVFIIEACDICYTYKELSAHPILSRIHMARGVCSSLVE